VRIEDHAVGSATLHSFGDMRHDRFPRANSANRPF
jgi:hypothetical protein